MEDPFDHPPDPPWLEQFRQGDFAALPDPLNWENSFKMILQVDGFGLAKATGVGDGVVWFTHERHKEARRTGWWSGTATELLLCLLWLHQSTLFSWDDPGRDEPALIQQLCNQVRQALQEIGPDERTRLMEYIKPDAFFCGAS